jgi:hypothetical protein
LTLEFWILRRFRKKEKEKKLKGKRKEEKSKEEKGGTIFCFFSLR